MYLDQISTSFAGAGRINGAINSLSSSAIGLAADVSVEAITLGAASAVIPVLSETYNNGITWTDIWTGNPMTAVGRQRVPALMVSGPHRWSFMSVGGASTVLSSTIIVKEVQEALTLRQFFDVYAAINPTASLIGGTSTASALVSTTLSSTSGIALIEGCSHVTVAALFTGGTPSTAPVYGLQVSMNGTDWITLVPTFSPTAAGFFGMTIANICARFARVIITTASSGGTPYGVTYVSINGQA